MNREERRKIVMEAIEHDEKLVADLKDQLKIQTKLANEALKDLQLCQEENEKLLEKNRKLFELEEILNGDGSLPIKASNLNAIAFHLEDDEDNGGITRDALAAQLRSIAEILEKADSILKKDK